MDDGSPSRLSAAISGREKLVLFARSVIGRNFPPSDKSIMPNLKIGFPPFVIEVAVDDESTAEKKNADVFAREIEIGR